MERCEAWSTFMRGSERAKSVEGKGLLSIDGILCLL